MLQQINSYFGSITYRTRTCRTRGWLGLGWGVAAVDQPWNIHLTEPELRVSRVLVNSWAPGNIPLASLRHHTGHIEISSLENYSLITSFEFI